MVANAVTGSAPPGGRKPLMKNPITWVVLLGVAVIGGYIIYKRRQASAAAAAATTTTGTDTTGQDITQGEAGTLQTEIMDLQSSEAQEPTGTTGSTGVTTGPIPGEPGPRPTGGGTKAGTPQQVHEGTVTSSSVQVLWGKAPNATAYDVRIAGKGTASSASKNYVTTRRVVGLSTTFTGLRADTPYAVDVQALPGGGTGTIRVTTKKAARKPTGATPKTSAAHTSKAA